MYACGCLQKSTCGVPNINLREFYSVLTLPVSRTAVFRFVKELLLCYIKRFLCGDSLIDVVFDRFG